MLKSMSELKSYQVYTEDGKIGPVAHLLIDLHKWAIRYFIVQSKTLRRGMAVVSPYAISRFNPREKIVELNVTAHELDKAPHFNDQDFPFPSRKQEESFHNHFGWQPYWIGENLWGRESKPIGSQAQISIAEENYQWEAASSMSHLASSSSFLGFNFYVHEGVFGTLQGFLFDEQTWSIKYLIIDSLDGTSVIVPPHWVSHIDSNRRDIFAELSETQIRGCPSYEGVRAMGKAVQEGHYFAYDPSIVSYTKVSSRPARTHS